MSPKHNKNVRQFVEKYRQQFPSLERPLLRKLIRLEKKIENPSELKKLDRYLAKAFKNEVKLSSKEKLSKPLKEYEISRVDETLRLIWCRQAIRREENLLDVNDPEYSKKLNELEIRFRKEYRLI